MELPVAVPLNGWLGDTRDVRICASLTAMTEKLNYIAVATIEGPH